MPRPRFDAVLFDLDGVLVDTEPWWDEVREAFAAANGRRWGPEDQAAVMGANSRGWARIMRERLGLWAMTEDAILAAIVDGVLACYRDREPPRVPGAPEALRRIAADRPVAIASSSHPAILGAAVDALGLRDVLGAVVSSDDVEHGKPAPDVYLRAAALLAVAPDRCLVVEDSINGVRAGRAAGMTVVLVPSHSVPPSPEARALAQVVLDRLADLDPDALPA
jgi:beta-phosphoglucomutase-like phosphatase (HAD superfamily)